jgi:hypothetical protein
LIKHTPIPEIAGLDANSPNRTDVIVQLMSGIDGYRSEHSNTEVAEPIIALANKVGEELSLNLDEE